AGMAAIAASARASATSKSSMRCRCALSLTIARMAALEISGVSKDEGLREFVMEQTTATLSGPGGDRQPLRGPPKRRVRRRGDERAFPAPRQRLIPAEQLRRHRQWQ